MSVEIVPISSLPSCPQYHPSSDLRTRIGYYPNLTAQHVESMQQLDDLIAQDGLDIVTDEENLYLKKLRFLRARQFNVTKAFEMLKNDTLMRKDHSKAGLRYENASEVLQCDLSLVYKYFPTWVQGFDKQSRPIAYRDFGANFEIWNILKLTTMERLIRFHAWEGEQAIRIMRERSEIEGCNVETFVVIIDAKGWHVGLATSDAYTYIKAMATTDSDHYPERLGRLLVINAPFALSFAWKVIKKFLDEVTTKKIQILSDPSDWQPVLFSFVERDQVPEMYGGTAPNPTPETAINSINPPQRSTHEERHERIKQLKDSVLEAAAADEDTAIAGAIAAQVRDMKLDAEVVPPTPPSTEEERSDVIDSSTI